jgi:hypothetical protein
LCDLKHDLEEGMWDLFFFFLRWDLFKIFIILLSWRGGGVGLRIKREISVEVTMLVETFVGKWDVLII